MKYAALFLALFLLPAVAFAQVKPADQSCRSDADCVIVQTACTTCCPTYDPNEVAAVNKDKEKAYENPNICTPEHIRACGVPECGLMPTPYPVAACVSGMCKVQMHPADRPAP